MKKFKMFVCILLLAYLPMLSGNKYLFSICILALVFVALSLLKNKL